MQRGFRQPVGCQGPEFNAKKNNMREAQRRSRDTPPLIAAHLDLLLCILLAGLASPISVSSPPSSPPLDACERSRLRPLDLDLTMQRVESTDDAQFGRKVVVLNLDYQG